MKRLKRAETEEMIFKNLYEKELKKNYFQVKIEGDDVIVQNPKLTKINSIWQETKDLLEEKGIQVSENPYLMITFDENGNIQAHSEYTNSDLVFIVNEEDILETSKTVEQVINDLIQIGNHFDYNLIINMLGKNTYIDFSDDSKTVGEFFNLLKYKLENPIDEHNENPENQTEQAIFDAEMSTMNRDYKIQQIKRQIDEALDNNDQQKFLELTKQYNDLLNLRASKGKRLLKKALII